MTKFQLKLKDYENKTINNDDISQLINDYNEKEDNSFLINEFQTNYQINQYYTRSLYEIIESLIEKNDFSDMNDFCNFLEKQLSNVETLSSLNKDIFIKIYLKLTKNTENVKKLYDEYISKKYINISTIEDFTEYFLNKDDNLYFIQSFLYDKEWWFRMHYYDYKSWTRKKFQDKILSFSKENLELFFDELNKKENIQNLLRELNKDKENNFIKQLINKALAFKLEKKIYEFLISQIRFAWSSHEYYSKNVFFNRNVKIFNLLKNSSILKYQQFFTDIKYSEPWYYYYNEFEQFIFKTIETSKDLESIAQIKELEEKEYFIRNGYFYVKYSLNNTKKSKLFEETFPEQIKIFEEQRQKSIEENQKYQDENDKEFLDEIKENVEKAKDTENKLFVPKFLEDFINKFDYQLRIENKIDIQELVKKQLEYFFTWKNLDITNPDILSKFKKTKTWYQAPNFMLDWSFWLVFESAQKVWFDLSKYKGRLACFYPFQGNGENLAELKKYFWLYEIKQIIDIYKKYSDIRGFQSYNIIYLFQEKYEREGIQLNQIFQEIKEDNNLKNDLVFILEELNKDENFNKYYLKDSLVLLYELGVEKSYFQSLELTQPSKNYFKDILQPEIRDDEFRKYLTINEFLIKNQDKDAFLWRLGQLLNGFIDVQDYEFENGKMRYIWDLENEIDNHYFIKILWEYKYIDEDIEQKVIELIEKSFKEYDHFENYCKYIWKGLEYYLKTLSKDLEYKNKLIDKITDLLSKSENKNKNIAFKMILWNISDKFLLKVEKEEDVRKYVEEIEDLKNKLNNKTFINDEVIIITEWPTDYNYFKKAFLWLNNLWKINKNLKYFLNYLKKTDNIDKIITYSNTISNDFCLKLAQTNPNKLVIWIFDTDEIPDNIKKTINDESRKLEKWGLFLTKLDNYFIILLETPIELESYYNKGICTELLFWEEFLEWKIITKKYKDSIEYKQVKLLWKNIYDMWSYYLDIKNSNKDTYIFDSYSFYEKITYKEDYNSNPWYKNKMNFSEDILNDIIKIDENILQNFQHIFDDISLLIDIELPKIQQSKLNDNFININFNQTFFQKISSKLKSILKFIFR